MTEDVKAEVRKKFQFLLSINREGSAASDAFYNEAGEIGFVLKSIHSVLMPSDIDAASLRKQGSVAMRTGATQYLQEFAHYKKHTRMVDDMALCGIVDNFVAYISDILAAIYRDRPATMKSGQMFTAEMILEHETMDDLIATIAEEKVGDLTRKSMRDLTDYLAKSHRLHLFGSDPADLKKAVAYNEIRNILVHKRGVIDRRFIKKVGLDYGDVGTRVDTGDSFIDFLKFFSVAVDQFDTQVVQEFKLQVVPRTALSSLDDDLSHF